MSSNSKAQLDSSRLSETPHLQKASTVHKISADEYSNLVVSILNYCEEADFKLTTAFYAKAYLDVYVDNIHNYDASRLPVVALTCLWIAVKFNEPRSKSQCFSIGMIHEAMRKDGSDEDIQAIETLVMQMLNYKLDSNIPLDYIQPFFQGFPWFSPLKNLMPQLLSFAISVPELTRSNSEDLFHGVFLACLQIKNCVLTTSQIEVLQTHIINKQSAQSIATTFTSTFYELSEENDPKNLQNPSSVP